MIRFRCRIFRLLFLLFALMVAQTSHGQVVQPCESFFARVTPETGTFDFCPTVGSVTFTAAAGFEGGDPEGTNIIYQWNFEGTQLTGAAVTRSYEVAGAYPFRFSAIDQTSGCRFDTIYTPRVATTPTFNNTLSTADTVCVNEPFTLAGSVQSLSWAGFPTAVESTAYITQGQPYTSALTFDVFPAGQQMIQMADFDRVCIRMEHEDFGHVAFELECPNGTSVLLKDYGPGGANLGEPVIYAGENIPGMGYEYCFNTEPQFGTMNETSFRFHSYTDQAGDIYFNQPFMPAGTYTPDESFQSFSGCPLNGTWRVNVQDRITGTSGHVLGWRMYFNETFYPDSLIFTPQIVQETWLDQTGNVIGTNPANATLATEGEYSFTYRVVDDFGCTNDTTIVVRALALPQAEIVSEIELPLCEGDSTLLTLTPAMAGEELNWLYQWSLEGAPLEGRESDTLFAKLGTYGVLVTDTITQCSAPFDLLVSDRNCDLNIPNVFTPNGDGINDIFEIENLEFYPNSVMVIYNRNGKKVYEHNDYYLNWWDGGDQAQGTYYYVLTYIRLGERRQTQGIITLLR